MQSIPEKWIGVREAEFGKLSNLVTSGNRLIHVLGPRGSGRTSIVRDVSDAINSVVVDCNTCGTVSGVMSAILRRLACSQHRSIQGDAASSDDELNASLKPEIKEEVSIATPEASEEDVTSIPTGPRRAAAVAATARLAAASSKRRRAPVRRRMDDFIDDDDSDSDAKEGSSSDDSESEKATKKQQGRSSNSVVPHDVFRSLFLAQRMRVKSPSAFVQKLERLFLRMRERTILIVDNIDCLLTQDDFDLDPYGKPEGGEFLRLLSRIDEYLEVPCGFSIVVISSRFLPQEVSSRCASVHLRPYTKEDARTIMQQNDKRYDAFLSTALAVLYPAFTGNFTLLRDAINRLFRSDQVQDATDGALSSKTKLVCAQELRRLFGGGDETCGFEEQIADAREATQSVKWLSRSAKQVLIAGYLAAHNPPGQDKMLLKTVAGKPGNKKRAASAFKKARLDADTITIRAPVPFPIHRLLAIYRFIRGNWEEDFDSDSGLLFQRTVRDLVHFGLFKTGAEDFLKTEIKLNCHAPLDLIQVVANEAGVKLDEVLYA